MATLATTWRQSFLAAIQRGDMAEALRDSSLRSDMRSWTVALTTAVVETCRTMGWHATAKGHRSGLLPVSRSEYLSLDALAFSDGKSRWRFPVAVMELENRADSDHIAYSLWKVMCVRTALRVVFCYRDGEQEGAPLVRALRDSVVAGMAPEERLGLAGDTLVVVGTRGEATTFPYGFFKWWALDVPTGQFQLI